MTNDDLRLGAAMQNVMLTGSDLDDTLAGGAGNDTIDGGFGNDSIDGNAGDDNLTGGFGNDTLNGGDGNDALYDATFYSTTTPHPSDDKLSGGAGNDALHSSDGSDTLDGGAGNDTLWINRYETAHGGARLTVVADGGDGDDRFHVDGFANQPADIRLSGGAGRDLYTITTDYAPSGAVTITDFQAGVGGDRLDAFSVSNWRGTTPFSGGYFHLVQRDADTVLQFDADGPDGPGPLVDMITLEHVAVGDLVAYNLLGYPPDGSTAGQVIDGTAGADLLVGTVLDDTIRGGDGADTISGNNGDDSIDGGAGNDTLSGYVGNDTVQGGAGDDFIKAAFGTDIAQGGAGNDYLVAGTGVITLDGGDGNDLLEIADNGTDWPDRATLLGGAGDDVFRVPVSDTIRGNYSATGGLGRDTFELGNVYTITDFQTGAGGDRIKLSTYPLLTPPGANPFADGHLRLAQSGADTLLQLDNDGDGGGTYATLLTLKNVQATAFTAENIAEGIDPHPTSSTPPATPVPGQSTTGTAGADHLTGGAGNDTLDGGAGDDILHGGAGNDILVGGAGLDNATYDGNAANYAVTHDSAGWHVAARTGTDGADTLQGVERLTFADNAIALDTDGVAGAAYRLYRAAFDRAPDLPGLGYWIGRMDQGVPLVDAAAGFVASREFIGLYGAAPSNADLVTRLYENILQRAPEQAGYDYWLNVLDTHRGTVAQVLAAFSESAENRDGTAALIANGIAFMPYHA